MDSSKRAEIETYIKKNVVHLESVLKDFGIEAKVVDYRRRPTITRHEITITRAIKETKVKSWSDDIEMKLAAIALKWAVNEMENRYRTFMEKGARNTEGYNS